MKTSKSVALPSLGRLLASDRLRIPEPEFPIDPTVCRGHIARLRSRRGLIEALEVGGSSSLPDAPRPAPRREALRALQDRITQGFKKAEYDRARGLGYYPYLEEQLDHLAIDDRECDARIAALPTVAMSPAELNNAHIDSPWIPYWELKGATLLRSVYSKRQLFERMCEFWSDHFSINHGKAPGWALKPEDDLSVVREHALGFFPDMLRASAHSGAMLYYLDNWLNVAGTPHANYAREFLELHTLGSDGGYTDADIAAVSRCMTGWTLETDEASPDYLRARFDESLHMPGTRTVLGVTIPAAPASQQLDAVIDILADHPSTARRVATKLTCWLLREDPPQVVVDQVAQTYLDTGGDIKEMIRVILARENLAWQSTVYRPKFRRPFHFVVSLLRGLDLEIHNPLQLDYFLYHMGHATFDWQRPDGYPDGVDAWSCSVLPRWTFASFLVSGLFDAISGFPQVLETLSAVEGAGLDGLAHRINELLLGNVLSPAHELAIQECLNDLAPLNEAKVFEGVAIAASAPGNQWF